ncbi:hypothetical protein [Bradyrhizobium genosp. P]|uniref:hypothetical protein n=1 Tax=Bradyrhizobium genosp. P TaxID=83641 RepID=UPI003CF65CA1
MTGTITRKFFEESDSAIDEIVAHCDADMRSALEALLLINEHLELENRTLSAAITFQIPPPKVPSTDLVQAQGRELTFGSACVRLA